MIKKQDSADFLRALINETNVTQTDVAKKTGVSLGLVGQWLRGGTSNFGCQIVRHRSRF